jgi:hypothetical protein
MIFNTVKGCAAAVAYTMGISFVVCMDRHAMLLPALAPMYFMPLENLKVGK